MGKVWVRQCDPKQSQCQVCICNSDHKNLLWKKIHPRISCWIIAVATICPWNEWTRSEGWLWLFLPFHDMPWYDTGSSLSLQKILPTFLPRSNPEVMPLLPTCRCCHWLVLRWTRLGIPSVTAMLHGRGPGLPVSPVYCENTWKLLFTPNRCER